MSLNRRSLLLAALGALVPGVKALAAAPPLMLATGYRPGMSLNDYWVSEKFDGVRAYWDGKQLYLRGGERVVAPAWFTAHWPGVPMDGELWAGRGRFEQAVSTARSQTPQDAAWREVRFMVFDLPAQPGSFTERLSVLRRLLPVATAPSLVPVAQQRATTPEDLQVLLERTVRGGGEGLMLHLGSAPYRAERSTDLLKVKTYEDADARVVAHVNGKGRNASRLGALIVEMPDGRRFKLGTGLTDAQREAPPPVGSWISYRYNGATESGLPRFARFLRERPDLG
ncbi:DNA ligase [Variovorax sp. OV329]|uniref:DNA ligase n=1 Tax=Variovorax sp. OV329 TaxID=1882825 RepID=UPI0008E415B0|nr:DNA ligase [Variovorax sp. OV329]SFM66839.1 DNA ligase-1 [Variovorax sp. OV329]